MSTPVEYDPIDAAELVPGLIWETPGINMGQTVEVSYAQPGAVCSGYGDLYQRITDYSAPAGQQVTYYRRTS